MHPQDEPYQGPDEALGYQVEQVAGDEWSRYQDEELGYQAAGEPSSQSGYHQLEGGPYYQGYHDVDAYQLQHGSTPMLLSSASALTNWNIFDGSASGVSTYDQYPEPPPALRAQESSAITPTVTPFHLPTALVGSPPTYPPLDLAYMSDPENFQEVFAPYTVTDIGEINIASVFRKIFKTGPDEKIRQQKRVGFLLICQQAVAVWGILEGKREPNHKAVPELMERIVRRAHQNDLEINVYTHHLDLWLDVLRWCYSDCLKELYHTVLTDLGFLPPDPTLLLGHDRALRELFDLHQRSKHRTFGYMRAPEKRLEKIVEDAEWLMTYILGVTLPTGTTNWVDMGNMIQDVDFISLLALITTIRDTMINWKLGLLPTSAGDIKTQKIPYIDILGSKEYTAVHQQLHSYSQGINSPGSKEYFDAFMTCIRHIMHIWHDGRVY